MTTWFSEQTDPALFRCPCGRPDCGAPAPTPTLLARLNLAREFLGAPIIVTSGVRCAVHNAAVGGVQDSEHTEGDGADLACAGSAARYALVEALRKAGFRRLGLYPRHVHVGVSVTLPQDVLWVGR